MSWTIRGMIPIESVSWRFPCEQRGNNSLLILTHSSRVSDILRSVLTSMVCVLPDEVCPYAKIVPLYPSRTSKEKQIVLVHTEIPQWHNCCIFTCLYVENPDSKHADTNKYITFYNLLGAGVVHLFLWGIWLKHSVKHVGFTLKYKERKEDEPEPQTALSYLSVYIYVYIYVWHFSVYFVRHEHPTNHLSTLFAVKKLDTALLSLT